MDRVMLAFKVDDDEISPIRDEIKTILQEEGKIWAIKNQKPHITIVMFTVKERKDEIMRIAQSLKKKTVLKPKELKMFRGPVAKRDFIVIEYEKHPLFDRLHKKLEEKDFEIRKFPGGMKPHISVVSCPINSISEDLFEHIKEKVIGLPKLKVKEIEIWNKWQRVDFTV
jgi:2'-5' RNA ligase